MTDHNHPSSDRSGTFAEGYSNLRREQQETEQARRHRLYMSRHYISQLKDVPKSAHFAVLVQKSRSYLDPYQDTNPRGDRTITDMYLEYIAFDSEEALKYWIEEQLKNEYNYAREKYTVVHVKPVDVGISTTINIKG